MRRFIIALLLLTQTAFGQSLLIEKVVHTSSQEISFKHLNRDSRLLYFTSEGYPGVLIYDFRNNKTILDSTITSGAPLGYQPMNEVYTLIQSENSVMVINNISKDSTFLIVPIDSISIPQLVYDETSDEFIGVKENNEVVKVAMNPYEIESLTYENLYLQGNKLFKLSDFNGDKYATLASEDGTKELYLLEGAKSKKLRYPLNYGEETYEMAILNQDSLVVARKIRTGEHQIALMYASGIPIHPDSLKVKTIVAQGINQIDSVKAESIIAKNEFTSEMNRDIGKGRWALLVERTTDAVKAMLALNKLLEVDPNAFSYKEDSVYFVLGPKAETKAELKTDSLYYVSNGIFANTFDLAEDSLVLPSDVVLRVNCIDKDLGKLIDFRADFYEYQSNTLIKSTEISSEEPLYFSYFPDYTLGLTITSNGYLPYSMKFEPNMDLLSTKRIEKLVLLSKQNSVIEQTFDLKNIFFDFDKYNLTPVAQRELDIVLKTLDTNKNIKVIGHTDHMGSEAYNLKLSKRRAKAVKSYLSSKNWKGSITTEGMGESKPAASNATEAGRSKNRRCEIVLLKN
jgi:outer membrane protein OmpA-like peptidoglycan-associated protein